MESGLEKAVSDSQPATVAHLLSSWLEEAHPLGLPSQLNFIDQTWRCEGGTTHFKPGAICRQTVACPGQLPDPLTCRNQPFAQMGGSAMGFHLRPTHPSACPRPRHKPHCPRQPLSHPLPRAVQTSVCTAQSASPLMLSPCLRAVSRWQVACNPIALHTRCKNDAEKSKISTGVSAAVLTRLAL